MSDYGMVGINLRAWEKIQKERAELQRQRDDLLAACSAVVNVIERMSYVEYDDSELEGDTSLSAAYAAGLAAIARAKGEAE